MSVIYRKEGKIAYVCMNQPGNLNPLSPEVYEGVYRNLLDARNDDNVRCLIITGSGRGFSSGADIKLRVRDREAGTEPGGALRLLSHRKNINNPTFGIIPLLRRMEKPVIAAINGVAAASGLSLALACDFRIASENARFTSAFLKRGLIPAGQTFLLPRIVGFAKALEIMLFSDILTAQQALEIGLVNKVVPADDLMPESETWANKLAAMPPIALGFAKQLAYKAIENDLLSQIDYEMQMMAICRDTNDHRESDKAFVEKRAAKFEGR